MKSIKQIVTLTGLFLVVLSQVPAHANDNKVFIGSMCDWQSHNVPEYRRGHVLRNTTTSNQWTTCPLVRDAASNSPEYISITVQGGVSGSCWLSIRKTNGGSIENIVHQRTYNLSNGKTLYEWFKGRRNGPSHNGAAYAIQCNLKPNAFVYSYFMSEN